MPINSKKRNPVKAGNIIFEGREDLSEKIRLFYVALTRAREKMIFVLPHVKEEVRIEDSTSFYDFLTRFFDLPLFEKELKVLIEKGKKVVIITDAEICFQEATVYVSENRGVQIGLIVDSRYALTGEFGEGSMNTCLYSGQKNFAALYKNALANEIKLIQYRKGE